MSSPITLTPLTRGLHAVALQEIYAKTPSYWQMYNLPSVPTDQADRDFVEADKTQGRTMMGIVRRIDRMDPSSGVELIGLADFRRDWPGEGTAYLGMMMVAEPYQRQGIGRKAWRLLMQWLKKNEIKKVRLGVEQFNPNALQFFQDLGFTLTGDTNRIKVGDKFVRLLYMEYGLEEEGN